ncbi:MAG: hypothetical protein WCJ02_15900 [bacterium]
MKDMIAGWVGQMVLVSIYTGSVFFPTTNLVGTLQQVSDSGILIKLTSGQTSYYPLATIHSIDLSNSKPG